MDDAIASTDNEGQSSNFAVVEVESGSIEHVNPTTCCYATRSTARKMKREGPLEARPATPPPAEQEKKDEKLKTHRLQKCAWTNIERDFFFEALNEFGKDFEALSNAVNAKLKRRNYPDSELKAPNQMRHHYNQTFHNISKHIYFSDEIKKSDQELYALINFGEMRRKLRAMKKNHYSKLKDLVYYGHVTIRWNRKIIRIKTPSCRALRRLNQLEDSLENIRLPSTIEVLLNPRNMDAFSHVHALAQNPRVRVTLPLHKRLRSVIQAFDMKWQSRLENSKQRALKKLNDKWKVDDDGTPTKQLPAQAAMLRFLPKANLTIYRPLISVTKQLSSVGLCLNAFEERMGFQTRSAVLAEERAAKFGKRSRVDVNMSSPERKKLKLLAKEEQAVASQDENAGKAETHSADELCDEINLLLKSDDDSNSLGQHAIASDNENNRITLLTNEGILPNSIVINSALENEEKALMPNFGTKCSSDTPTSTGNTKASSRPIKTLKPILTDQVLKRMRKGWTIDEAMDITVGDLYVAFGENSQLELDYCWCVPERLVQSNVDVDAVKENSQTLTKPVEQISDLVRPVNCAKISSKLKHLIYIASMSIEGRRRCNCEDTVDLNAETPRTYVVSGTEASGPIPLFKRPLLPLPGRRPVLTIDPLEYISKRKRVMTSGSIERRILQPGGVRKVDHQIYGRRLQNEDEEEITTEAKKELLPASDVKEASTSNAASLMKHNEKELDKSEQQKTPTKSDIIDDDNSIMNWANGNGSLSNLWRDQTPDRWLEENGDVSLGSIMRKLDHINTPRQNNLDTSSNLSFLSETSVDYRQKFQDLRAILHNAENANENEQSMFCPQLD